MTNFMKENMSEIVRVDITTVWILADGSVDQREMTSVAGSHFEKPLGWKEFTDITEQHMASHFMAAARSLNMKSKEVAND